jgi:DNA-binding Xre family transcriptional regulator
MEVIRLVSSMGTIMSGTLSGWMFLKRKRWQWKELERKADCGHSTLWRAKNSIPIAVKTIESIAEALGTSVIDLLDPKDPTNELLLYDHKESVPMQRLEVEGPRVAF